MARQGRKILVVDSDPVFRGAVARYLKRAGHRTATACCGWDCLALLDEFSPDLILLELARSVMSGSEFLATLRTMPRWSGIPVLLVTAGMRTEAAALVERGEAAGMLVKSHFSLGDVLVEVDRLTADFAYDEELDRVA